LSFYSNAQLSVTLRNSGNDAYLKEKYGGKIRIERRLTKEGGSTYKIFSEKSNYFKIYLKYEFILLDYIIFII